MSITIGGSILGGQRALDQALDIVRDHQDAFEVRAVSAETGEIEAVISTREVDRYNSIILPSGFDRLIHRFEANPAFLWMHNRNVPLGTVKKIWRDDDQVYAIFSFDLKNRFAAEVFRWYQEGIMRAFSVQGAAAQLFYSWQSAKERDALKEIDYRAWAALDAEECYYVISEIELYEVSAVTIGGNWKALKRAHDAGLIDQEFADLLGISRAESPTENHHDRKEPDTEMDRIPKELVERIDNLTKSANELIEERKAAQAKPGLSDEQKAEVRQLVLDTIASVYADDDEDEDDAE